MLVVLQITKCLNKRYYYLLNFTRKATGHILAPSPCLVNKPVFILRGMYICARVNRKKENVLEHHVFV